MVRVYIGVRNMRYPYAIAASVLLVVVVGMVVMGLIEAAQAIQEAGYGIPETQSKHDDRA